MEIFLFVITISVAQITSKIEEKKRIKEKIEKLNSNWTESYVCLYTTGVFFMHFNLMKWNISDLDDDRTAVLVSHILYEKNLFFSFIYLFVCLFAHK